MSLRVLYLVILFWFLLFESNGQPPSEDDNQSGKQLEKSASFKEWANNAQVDDEATSMEDIQHSFRNLSMKKEEEKTEES